MTTRMEKYYHNNENISTRTSKNSNLYDEMYDNVKYTNVEGIAKIEKTNEIDISKIKELIKEHEEQKERDYRIVKKIVLQPSKTDGEVDLEQYDLKQIINAAKKERPQEEKERYIKSVKYMSVNDKLKEIDDDINLSYLTDSKALSELGDYELSLDLLDNFKDDVEETFDEIEKENNDSDDDMDNSFYTSNMHFSREDFEELEDINKDLKRNNIWITILVFILLVIVITGCLFLFDNIM